MKTRGVTMLARCMIVGAGLLVAATAEACHGSHNVLFIAVDDLRPAHTQSLGKIYHGSGRPAKDPPSWSVQPLYDFVRDPTLRYALPSNLQGTGLKQSAVEAADVADNVYVDGMVCEAAMRSLAELQGQQQPFFLAVGFRKPHLPFCAPQKYWDLYDRAMIPLPVSGGHPHGAPELATRSWMELEPGSAESVP